MYKGEIKLNGKTYKVEVIAGWGIVVNENKAAMAILNRDELIETMKYIEVLEQRVKETEDRNKALHSQLFDNKDEIYRLEEENKKLTETFELFKHSIAYADNLSNNLYLNEIQQLKEELFLLRNESFTEGNLIDFVNYYLKLHELPFRYTLENRTIIEEWKLKSDKQK